jgi:hypothetical protein
VTWRLRVWRASGPPQAGGLPHKTAEPQPKPEKAGWEPAAGQGPIDVKISTRSQGC